jgi:hypothetical protein
MKRCFSDSRSPGDRHPEDRVVESLYVSCTAHYPIPYPQYIIAPWFAAYRSSRKRRSSHESDHPIEHLLR